MTMYIILGQNSVAKDIVFNYHKGGRISQYTDGEKCYYPACYSTLAAAKRVIKCFIKSDAAFKKSCPNCFLATTTETYWIKAVEDAELFGFPKA